jgi:hypothetical protein
MKRFINWLASKISPEEEPPPRPLRHTGPRVRPKPAKPRPSPADPEDLEFSGELGGKIVDGGPGKNVLVRNKYVREDSGTHETLKIIDDSLVEEDDEGGADPYNTGRFDRSKSWDSSRSRK